MREQISAQDSEANVTTETDADEEPKKKELKPKSKEEKKTVEKEPSTPKKDTGTPKGKEPTTPKAEVKKEKSKFDGDEDLAATKIQASFRVILYFVVFANVNRAIELGKTKPRKKIPRKFQKTQLLHLKYQKKEHCSQLHQKLQTKLRK